MGRSCPGYAADVRQAVNCDLAGAAVKLLEDVRASREGERERGADSRRAERDRLLDEELAVRSRCRRFADDRL